MIRTKEICDKCNIAFSKSNIKRHKLSCKGLKNYDQDVNDYFCIFCKKECKNKNSLSNHQRLCKNNPNRQFTFFSSEYNVTRTATNQFIKAEKLGLEKPIFSNETRIKISKKKKNVKRSIESRSKQSKTIYQKVLNHEWFTPCKKPGAYIYKDVMFHSSWEMKYAIKLDELGILWERNTKRFPYKWNNKTHLYIPDFYLPETNEYIEIKGYSTDRDHCKWHYFPKNEILVILKYDQLKELGVL